MLICGIKLTHDGAIAVLDGNRLVFSEEMEKRENADRYTEIRNTDTIAEVLDSHGMQVGDIGRFVIDGWGGNNPDELAIQPRLEVGKTHNWLSASAGSRELRLPIAQYHEASLKSPVMEGLDFSGLEIASHSFAYRSYLHAAGHIASAYCASPFAQARQDAFVLLWDGGMFPRLYSVSAEQRTVQNHGPLFLLIGNIYSIFSQHFGPFRVNGSFAKDSLSVAGKVMAYTALGTPLPEMYPLFDEIYREAFSHPMGFANKFANEFKQRIKDRGYRDEDVLCTFHHYLEKTLVEKLQKKLSRVGGPWPRLCIAGGCGLNIKWNSAIRDSGVFEQVFVPPFPNDSGSAIGMACCELMSQDDFRMEWSVYSGPRLRVSQPEPGWSRCSSSIAELAGVLAAGEPVVFLHGRAELGPRALGNRSILAHPGRREMHDLLNAVKEREAYRPVSPICMETHASAIFAPGFPDPFMLFDHHVRPGWEERIPAVRHLDGTARLQTVNESENPVIHQLLAEFHRLTGLPLLCNTSANFKGKGFFPDLASATRWNRLNYVWCDGELYERVEKLPLHL